jgi:hypothetical protein
MLLLKIEREARYVSGSFLRPGLFPATSLRNLTGFEMTKN